MAAFSAFSTRKTLANLDGLERAVADVSQLKVWRQGCLVVPFPLFGQGTLLVAHLSFGSRRVT